MGDQEYQCGFRPGQRVRLLKDLVIRDHRGRPTGVVHREGEIWTVLPDCCTVRHDLWLQQPDGEPHTWDDDASALEWFEVVSEGAPDEAR
jgi:hypothetical protein